MKFRRRKKDVVPQAVIDAAKLAGHSSPDATRLAALAHAGVSSVDQMKLHHWQKYMREFKESAAITDIFRDVDDDYDETTASDAWKEISDTKIYTTTHVGIGTSDPDVALHIRGAIKVEDGFSLAHNHGSHPSVAIDTQNFGIDETVNDLTGMGSNKYTKLYRVYGTNSQGVGKNWYWGYANDDYTNFSLSSDGAGGNDPDIGFVFTSTSELHCKAVHAALSGNADTATKLQTARQINGVAFDGSADITIPKATISSLGLTNSATITATTAKDGNKIVLRESNGNILGNFFNTTPNDVESGVTRVCVETGDDGWIRHGTQAAIRTFLGLGAMAYAANGNVGLQNSATITASASAGNSTLVQRHSSGYIYANYFNTTPDDVGSGVTKVCVETGNDGFIRHGTQAAVRTFLGLGAMAYAANGNVGLQNSATIAATSANTANQICQRNSSGDIFCRLFRSEYQNQSDCGAGIAFRNSTSDNYIRFCSNMGNVRSRIGCYGSGSNITRTSHSNGFLVGSYNNVGGNDAKTNPIYTIGSNYQPSDTSLSNMYGIGYSHGNFTSILTGGWGMYVAADGDARIGFNASSGNIKCTGYITAGGNVTAYSDIRGKENIKRIENPLERIEKMNGYIYNKKEEPTKKYTGVVAQELLEVLPEVVEGNEKDGYAVAYGNFAGIFIEAIKELKAQLQVEKSRNDRLEALMTTFNSRLDNVN